MTEIQDSRRKTVYFEDREIDPELAELYHDRLGAVTTVLDLGCGTGGIGRHLGGRGVDVVGADIDIGALQSARSHERAVRVDLGSGRLPFQSETFDGIVAKDILEHLVRPADIVGEMYRVLEPGGRIVVSVPMAKPRVVWQDYTHIRGFTRDALVMMMRDPGFEILSVTPMGGVPGAGRLNLHPFLPTLLQFPILRRFAVSHELVAQKPRA